jgi:hypothetical protein
MFGGTKKKRPQDDLRTYVSLATRLLWVIYLAKMVLNVVLITIS